MFKTLALPTLLALAIFTIRSPAAPVDLGRALARVTVMTKVRVLLTTELRVLLTAAEYASIAPMHPQVRALRDRQITSARRSIGLLGHLFQDLVPLLDDAEERVVADAVVARLSGPVGPDDAETLVPISEDGTEIVGEALDVMRTLERVAATLGEDLHSTTALVARVDRLLERAPRTAISQVLSHALELERVQVAIAPIFARHSLTKLCGTYLGEAQSD